MHGGSGGRRRALAGVSGAAAAVLLAGCGNSVGIGPAAIPPAPQAPVAVSAVLRATPADGASGVLADVTPTLELTDGKFSSVLLHDVTGYEIPGTLTAGGARWHATGALAEGRSYTFEATGTDSHGHPFRNSSSFTTIAESKVVKAWVSPLAGATVGVGQPIAVEFSHPVGDRAAVERRLRVETSQPVVGAWHWESGTVVHYRPEHFWPANTRVVLHADLKDLPIGGGRFGDEDRTIPFTVSREQITVVDVRAHRMEVFRDGTLLRTIDVSTGKKGYLTRGGTKVVLGLERKKHMTGENIGIQKDDPDYFDLHVKYAVRMTWSGEFLHAAPWQGSNHGRANVSHGCVGMSTSDAKWFFDHTIIGDVIQVKNSPRRMELRNGYGDWNLSWSDWLAGSALPQAATTSDAGQTPPAGRTGSSAAPTSTPGTATPTPTAARARSRA